MTADRPRLLAVGDGVVPTGFARVMHSLLDRLRDRWEIHHLAINYDGGPHGLGWEVHPAASEGDFWGANRIRSLVEQTRPDLVFLLNDPWVIGSYVEALREVEDRPRLVAYSPVDAGPLEPAMLAPLIGPAGLDRLILYTEFGRSEIECAFAQIRQHAPGLRFPELGVLPHGVDTGLFHPLPAENGSDARRLARERLLPAPEFRDAFIVLNANRNQPRKRIDVTIKGFARFAQDKPENVRLYLHMGTEDCGWNVIALARRHGIEDRLILTAEEKILPAVTDDVLNCIYNACDVGINTSLGEGWGLVNLEHAATGAAQVVPRHSACEEIWDRSALLLEPAMSLTTERILTEGRLVSPDEVARALEALYRDPDLLAEMSAAAYRVATRPDFQWDDVAERWNALFHEVLFEVLDNPAAC